MKPNFALTLSFEGIGLLHRTYPGWHLVGEVSLDAADLAGELAGLAAKARALDPTGLRSKIVLPPEQIKYLAFETATRDIGEIEALVRSSLDGATPYSLRDLSYDWSMQGDRVHVAAVARETLAEAEAFAVEHGFTPLCFVAMPEPEQFVGEPFFGETAHAGKVLGPDESIDRESEVIRIVGMARLPEPPAPEPEQEPPEQAVAMPAPAVSAATRPEPEPETGAPPPEPEGGEKPEPEPGDAAKPEPEPAAPIAFSSRRSRAGAAPRSDGPPPRIDLPKARITPPAKPDKKAGKKPAGKPAPPSGPVDEPRTPAADEAPTIHAASLLPDDDDAAPTPAGTAPEAESAPRAAFLSRRKALAGARALGQSLGKARLRPRREAPAAAPLAVEASAAEDSPGAATAAFDEKARMTVFGARRMETARDDRPRYLALILTAILLLVLVAVAAWAALFLDDGISGLFRWSDETRVAATEEAGPPPAEPADILTVALPDEAPGTTAPDNGLTGLRPEPTPGAETAADTALRDVVPEELTPDEARARYAATGIWQVAPRPSTAPAVTTLQDVYQTNLDPPVDFGDAVALPRWDALRPDPRPPTPADPPPPGATYELDERGFIAATPEGTQTPEGVTIFAGRPPVLPPPTPPRAAPEILEGPEAAAPREPTLRPRLRPDDLTELFERTSLGGRTRAELATLRPRLRPQSAQELAEEKLLAEAGTGEGATDQAVAVSARPRARPGNFAEKVALAREATAAEPVSAAQRVEPEIPTVASVARAATERNQISLRRVNLIGIYGSPDNRRALVRLANGRYRKVQVGDRLDGGQVAAIGDDELRYIKSGRSVVLKMPKG